MNTDASKLAKKTKDVGPLVDSALQELLPRGREQMVSLSREKIITFGGIFLSHGLSPTEILREMTGIKCGVIPEPALLDPLYVSGIMRASSVSKRLLKHLGIEALTIERKPIIDENVVRRLLEFFSFLTPLDTNTGFRISIVNNRIGDLIKTNFTPKELPGAIFFRIKDAAAGPALHCFGKIYSAFRKTNHQAYKHDVELKKIAPLVQRVDRAVTMLASWRILEEKVQQSLKRQSGTLAIALERELGRPRNKDKRRAIEIGMAAVGLKDSRNHTNILGNKTRYQVIADRLLSRIGDVSAIDRFNRDDRTSLLAAILEQEVIVRRMVERTSETQDFIARLIKSRSFNVEGYLRNIGIDNESLSKLKTRPFLTFREQLLASRAAFILSADSRDSIEAQKAFSSICLILRAARVEICLQWAKFELVAGRDGAQSAMEWVKKAGEVWGRSLFPAPFCEVRKALEDAYKACRDLSKANKREQSTKLLSAKKMIDSAEIEKLIL